MSLDVVTMKILEVFASMKEEECVKDSLAKNYVARLLVAKSDENFKRECFDYYNRIKDNYKVLERE